MISKIKNFVKAQPVLLWVSCGLSLIALLVALSAPARHLKRKEAHGAPPPPYLLERP
jgi:uncharacterized membrane protein